MCVWSYFPRFHGDGGKLSIMGEPRRSNVLDVCTLTKMRDSANAESKHSKVVCLQKEMALRMNDSFQTTEPNSGFRTCLSSQKPALEAQEHAILESKARWSLDDSMFCSWLKSPPLPGSLTGRKEKIGMPFAIETLSPLSISALGRKSRRGQDKF